MNKKQSIHENTVKLFDKLCGVKLIKENEEKNTFKLTKIGKGEYEFEGIDNWTQKPMKGRIVYQPIDKPLSRAWEVRFEDTPTADFMGRTAKECVKWLTD